MSHPSADVAAAARAMLDADTASASLGIEVVWARQGCSAARMQASDRMVNGHGIVHGGFLFLLADTAFAAACNSHGPVTVAAGAEISFVAAVRPGDALVATARERTRFGRNGIYDVTVHRETPQPREVVAEFRGRSRTVARPRD